MRLQAFALEPLPQILRRQLDGLEGNVRRGVEIEDQAVGIIDGIDARAPGMDFDRAHLDDFEQALLVFDIEVFVTLALVLELEGLDVRAQALAGIALIEALVADAGRAAQQAERMAQRDAAA